MDIKTKLKSLTGRVGGVRRGRYATDRCESISCDGAPCVWTGVFRVNEGGGIAPHFYGPR